MRPAWLFPTVLTGTLAVATLSPGAARADDNDLVLARLGDGATDPDKVIADNVGFRSLVSELGVVLAPRFLSPADTLGYSGFQFSADLSFTSISASAAYWCATEETPDCASSKDTSTLTTFGIFARKGIWLPLPSIELGAGATHLLSSGMWAAQAYAKFAVHEGFHAWPIPSLAVRGAVSRLMGSEQLDLTVGSIDVSVSKSFGVGGTVELSPYGGWNLLWMVPRSEVIDKTPNIDAFEDMTNEDLGKNFVFPDQDNVLRQRLFFGVKAKYYVFAFTAEAVFALAGSSVDDREGTDMDCAGAPAQMKDRCDATDEAGGQQTYTFSVAMDF